jgi:ABC-type transport system involved in multi-copper enzyme maturation permease subunit
MLVLIVAISIGTIAFFRGYSSKHTATSSKCGWYGFGLLALLFAGLLVAGIAKNEPATYGFGLALMIAFPIMTFVGIASALGRAISYRKKPPPKTTK